jgi:chromosome segregation ATPase
MTDFFNTYPDLANVEDWLNAKGYTGEAGACHQAMSLIRSQEKRIADLRKEADMMHSEYKTARASINDLKAALEAKDRRISELEKMLAVHRLAVDVDALKARIAELEAENRALRNEYKAVNQELTEMQGKYQTTRAALGEKN